MLRKELTPIQRVGYGLAALLAFAVTGLEAWIITHYPLPPGINIALGVLGLTVLVIGIIKAIPAITGTVNQKMQPKTTANIVLIGYSVVVGVAVTVPAFYPLNLGSLYIVAAFTVVLVMAMAGVTRLRIRESEMAMREELLEIKLRLAEISEALADKQE
jgi:hypothetical protein